MYYNDGTSIQWVQINGVPFGAYLKLTGGIITGDLLISKSGPTLTLNKLAGGEIASLVGSTNNAKRWTMMLGDAALESGTGNTGSNFLLRRFDDAGVSLGDVFTINRATGAAAFSNDLLVSGAASKPGGGAWTDSSDQRVKTVIGEYDHGLDEIKQLNPVRFSFKGNDSVLAADASDHAKVTDKEFIGLIAQDVEEPMPELVRSVPGWIDGKKVNDYRVFDSTALTYALINAVKQLSSEVDALRAEIVELKK